MKKLFVLFVVLGMASVANASLSLLISDTPGGPWIEPPPASEFFLQTSDIIWIGVNNNAAGYQYDFYMYIEGPGSWTGAVSYAGYPYNVPEAFAYVYPQTVYGYNSRPEPAPGLMPGVGLDFEFHCDGLGTVTIYLDDTAAPGQDVLIIHQIPEPMTMALLGLGGLALLRRRR